NVFHRVVDVDIGVTRCAHGEVGERVLGEGGQEVIEERHSRVDVASAGAVEVDVELDSGLARRAADRRSACGGTSHEADSTEPSAAVAAAWVSALRWYGSRTRRSASMTAASAAR